jgi:hypothetical protein
LLAHAIRAGWPVPWENRDPILDAVCSKLTADEPRRLIAIAHVCLAAGEANLKNG